MSISIYFPCFIYFFRVWGVNWIDSGDACTSQELYRDLLFWLSSCYGAVHYWFHFSSLLLPLTVAFASYLSLLSRSLFPTSSLLLALTEKQQVVICKSKILFRHLRDSSYSRLLMPFMFFVFFSFFNLVSLSVAELLCFGSGEPIKYVFFLFHSD